MKNRNLMHLFRTLQAPEGDAAGGGGGGGGGGDPKPVFTEDQQKALGTMIAGALKGWSERIKTDIGGQLKGVTDAIEKLKPAEPNPDDKKPKDTELAKLTATVTDLTKRLEASDAEKKAIEARTARAEERTALERALSEAGIKDARLAGASALLFLDRQVVARREDGGIGWKTKKSVGGQVFDEIVELKEGVTEFLKTDEGKAYLPPRNVEGQGFAGGTGLPAPARGSKEERMAAAAEQLGGFLQTGGMGGGWGEAPDPRK